MDLHIGYPIFSDPPKSSVPLEGRVQYPFFVVNNLFGHFYVESRFSNSFLRFTEEEDYSLLCLLNNKQGCATITSTAITAPKPINSYSWLLAPCDVVLLFLLISGRGKYGTTPPRPCQPHCRYDFINGRKMLSSVSRYTRVVITSFACRYA